MKKRISKLILSCFSCLFLVIGFSVSAYADVIGGAGLLSSALGSLGVDLLAGGSATVAALAPWLNGDFSIVGVLTGVADGYIKVGDESVTIDGVQYESIYLDPSMAAELHTQAFDFITQKAITSNSSGILAAGVGHLSSGGFSTDIYQVGNEQLSQGFSIDSSPNTFHNLPLYYCYVLPEGSSITQVKWSADAIDINGPRIARSGNVNFPITVYSKVDPVNGLTYKVVTGTGSSSDTTIGGYTTTFTQEAFNYSYVAGIIDSEPLPANYGFQAFVPTQTLAQAGFSTGTYVIDGGTGTDAIIELIQLIDELYGQEEVLDAEFVDEVVPPVPPQPIDTPLGEVPYEDFLDTFGQSVYGKLDAISDGVDTLGNIIDGAGTDVITAVDTAGQSVVEELEVIGGAIDTAGQSVVDSVEESTGILEEAIEAVEAKVDELVDSIADVVEEIMTHPLDLFSAWLDRLPEIPAIKDIFDGIKRHVGIWHYVVEWIGCIGTFLAFFIGLFGDVAYCMVVPIYACVAGAICLAFYKRFAR